MHATMDEGGTAYLLGASGSQLGGGRSLGLSPPGPRTQDAIRNKWGKIKEQLDFVVVMAAVLQWLP